MPLTFDEPDNAGLTFDEPKGVASRLSFDEPERLTFDEPEVSTASGRDIAKTLGQSIVSGVGNIGRDMTETFIKYFQGPELKYMRTSAAAQEVADLEEKGCAGSCRP